MACALVLGGAGPDTGLRRVPILVGLVVWVALAGQHRLRALAGVCALVSLVYAAGIRPSHDRTWTLDQSRLPRVSIAGDAVTIRDARAFRYRATDDYDPAWVDRTLDLGALQGVDFAVERFTDNEAVAHTLVSFRFADAEPLVVSVEIRKEQGESYSPFRGLFRQYELMYVLGDERDLLELRAVHRQDDVYLHPMRATPEQARAFLVSLLEGARSIEGRPRFYNTVSASCTSVLAWHLREVADVGLDHRIFLPGYSDALAFDLGLIDTEVDFAATRAANHINRRAEAAAGAADFSARIRAR